MKHIIYYFWTVVLLFTYYPAHATFNQAAFDRAAALYGNKTANLIELQKNY